MRLFKKNIVSLQISLISLVILNFAFFDISLLKSSILFRIHTKINTPVGRANLLVCIGSGRPQRRVISPRF